MEPKVVDHASEIQEGESAAVRLPETLFGRTIKWFPKLEADTTVPVFGSGIISIDVKEKSDGK